MSKLTLALFVSALLVLSTLGTTFTIALPSAAAIQLTNRQFGTVFDDNDYTFFHPGGQRVCGEHICAPGEYSTFVQNLLNAQLKHQAGHNMTQNVPAITNKTATTPPPTNMTQPTKTTMTNMTHPTMTTMANMWATTTGTVTSVQDPGIGHESHQLAIILPPSNKIYTGTISWAASEPIQIVELTGPLATGDDKGQPIWTTDGKTKFALTLVDVNQASGSFAFTGNALAIHQMTNTTFTVSYAVSYMQSSSSDTVKTGTLTSIQDPGIGHESHQLALILPPSANPYHGILTYSASENVQLVSLIGPITPSDQKGQPVYTMDGKTWYALVFVDPGNQMGTWEFSGNAIAVHTMHTTQFQVSYAVDAHQ